MNAVQGGNIKHCERESALISVRRATRTGDKLKKEALLYMICCNIIEIREKIMKGELLK